MSQMALYLQGKDGRTRVTFINDGQKLLNAFLEIKPWKRDHWEMPFNMGQLHGP